MGGNKIIMKYIDVDKELELAHKDYKNAKRITLYNLKAVKQCYKKLYQEERIGQDTYKALCTIANNTIEFIKMKEI